MPVIKTISVSYIALQDVAEKIKTLGITALHIKLRATGRHLVEICILSKIRNAYSKLWKLVR